MAQEATVPNASLLNPKEAIIRSLNPLDPVRCTIMDSPDRSNRACSLDSIIGINSYPVSIVKATRIGMSVRGRGSAAVVSTGNRVLALASAQPRSGPGSWDITHLYVSPAAEDHVAYLLSAITQAAIEKQCQRIFLRLRQDDPLVDIARQGGFFPRVPETLFIGRPSAEPRRSNSPNRNEPLSEENSVDGHDLFRLFNAATPSEMRQAIGITMDQWTSSRERLNRRSGAYVMRRQDSAIGSMRTSRKFSRGWLEASAHPNNQQCMPTMVKFGLEKLESCKTVYCMMPNYQVDLRYILVDNGFEKTSEYITLVNSMTVKAIDDIRLRSAVPIT